MDTTSLLAVPICSYVVVPRVLPISLSGLSIAGLRQLFFAKALILAFGILSRRDMPKIIRPFSFGKPGSSSSGFVPVSRFGSRKVVLGRYRIPVLRIVVSDFESYLVG